MYNYPYVRPGLFSRLFNSARGFSFGGFLDGTQKTLGVINQAIPIVNQVRPMINNARTMFRIADEIRKPVSSNTSNNGATFNQNVVSNTTNNAVNNSLNKPVFYM